MRWTRVTASIFAGVALVVACGSENGVNDDLTSVTSQNDGGGDDGASSSNGSSGAGSSSGGSSGGSSSGGSSGTSSSGGSSGTSSSGGSSGGTDGGSTDGGGTDGGGGGGASCPQYTTLCGGVCKPTISDPNNCGACNNICQGGQACAAGTCSNTCPPGSTKCGNRCVDVKTDNTHCGACNATPCTNGQACIDGACGNVVVGVSSTGPTSCQGSTTSPTNPSSQGGCLGNLAQTVFRWAVCSCKDLQFSGNFLADAFDSSKGPYTPGGLGAGVGANENYGTSGTSEIWGTFWVAGSGGITPSLTHTVKMDLRSGGALKSSSTFTIGGDAYAEQEVQGGTIPIAKTLFVPGGTNISGNVTYASLMQGPVSVAEPCDFCDGGDVVPIASIVDAHSGSANDNATVGLSANALANPSGPVRLDLPCGEYYLSSIASSHHVAIVAHGRTALYIDGDVAPNGITLQVDPGAELNVFVKGNFGTSGKVRIGSPAYPAAMRLYVAGTGGFNISDEVTIGGNIYVPHGAVQYSSSSDHYGAIYAGNFSTSKDLKIHYDKGVLDAASACQTPTNPGGSDGGGGTDGGGITDGGGSNDGSTTGGNTDAGGGQSCGSCKDCGNQACVTGSCGACASSSQCCAPLVCNVATGRCIASLN